jgi:hypothetical protein
MYPPDHPSLEPVVDNIRGRLEAVFADGRKGLSIGVGRRRLVIGNAASDPSHPVLADLARRLHGHHISAVSFERGVRPWEIEGLLQALSGDTERDAQPIGLLPADEVPGWDHVDVAPVGYEKLSLQAGALQRADPTEFLWLELARAALTTDAMEQEAAMNVVELAQSIRRGGDEEGYDEVIVSYLRQLSREFRYRETGDALRVRQRVAELVEALDEETLTRLVRMGAPPDDRGHFLHDVTQGLTVDSVVRILEAAARSEGQTISTSLARLLRKLSANARPGAPRGRPADAAVRDVVEHLVADWYLDDPNPEPYTVLLDSMAGASPLFDRRAGGEEELAGAERVVQTALEVDVWGGTVRRAVMDLLAVGQGRSLLDLTTGVEGTSAVAEEIRGLLARPEPLRQLFSGPDVDEQALHALVEKMGPAALDPLLEVLSESESRTVRRRVFDVLGRLGRNVAERAAQRLDDPRWFVVRNMLALLGRLGAFPEDIDLSSFTRHPDARVRREAFVLAIKREPLRARTLAQALAEEDERLVRMALLELEGGVPEALVPTVVKRVLQREHPPEVRAMAVRALDGSGSDLARNALVDIVSRGKSLLGRVRLAGPAPDVLAALSVLGRHWSGDADVEALLDVARKSKDEAVRGAVERAP